MIADITFEGSNDFIVQNPIGISGGSILATSFDGVNLLATPSTPGGNGATDFAFVN